MKQSSNTTSVNKVIGNLGETITVNYLKNKSFQILDRNYSKKWGEIDIVARENNTIHFVEVKTVSYETRTDLELSVSRGTWRPEERVHNGKLRKINRAIQSWLNENGTDTNWQIDVAAVRIVLRERYATVKYIDNIIFS